MTEPIGKSRRHIPKDLHRKLLLECGYRCSVPRCDAQWPTLQFHHIDENPDNSTAENLLVLCPTHHQMVTSKHIDKKSCELLKQSLTAFSDVPVDKSTMERNRMLYTLASELFVNLNVLSDKKFSAEQSAFTIYPRLLHIACDAALSSGMFISQQDGTLYKRLFGWAEVSRDFNRRLEFAEARRVAVANSSEAETWQRSLAQGQTIRSVRERCRSLATYLIDNYGDACSIDYDTVFFEDTNTGETSDIGGS